MKQYLARFGPVTVADIAWWTGWTLRDTRRALAAIDTAAVDLEGEPALVLAGDLEPVAEPEPWVALLPALDPTPMGWVARDWYITAEQRQSLFDRTGNIGPTVWCNGHVVGGWAQRPDGEIAWRLLEDIGTELRGRVAAEADRLMSWIGAVRVIPRFRHAAGPRTHPVTRGTHPVTLAPSMPKYRRERARWVDGGDRGRSCGDGQLSAARGWRIPVTGT